MTPLKTTLASALLAASVFVAAPVALAAPPVASPAVAALPDFADIVERTGPGVVNIRTTERVRQNAQGQGGVDDPEMQEFFRRFFGIPIPRQQQPGTPRGNGKQGGQGQQEEVPRGVGSGFIISADGFIMTNAHVVEGASEVYVTLTDKREFKAKIVGSDTRTDVAVLKIDGSNLPRLNMGDSDKIRVGEWVLAIGSPFGLENTVTAGIVSAKARDTGDYLPLIQTDVAVNPGNSGGPLINLKGEVIGINSQIYSRSGGFMGISFAVPIDEALRVADQLKASGRVTRGRIGVQIGEVTKDVAESLGLARAQGALVQRVEAGGPAEKAGLEAGDIILKYNGAAIERPSDLPRMVGSTKPGAKATVSIWRKGSARDVSVTVVELEADKPKQAEEKKAKPDNAPNSLGLVVSDLSDAQRKELKVDNGVLVEAVSGAAAAAGIRPGDVIQRLNEVDVKDAKQFAQLVSKLDAKKRAAVLVRRGDSSQFVPLRPNGGN
ncbi:DegQ family serine endoprotease [Herbaspirillum seropedicae]|uniref:Probable periplasmic serine endoprotease DegP-like n=1 Tax=Herbaspirillum seropedicae (strain SmR1) TaxID=757424 RepID=D8IS96_HERSS|nr:DegQ family serine endoprotease [Herbaspirillum seropedicae]ADJ63440.1 periplasmic trypsin-like serine protease, containing C-terminal PDZ domain protein [Herbaspirillum seropedicae SmR1]AKN65473.1 serine peptidase [Herbaspirillum seropedicae]NQE28634.1 serine peptidase [Herbaspirillum seropedicae]QDD64367.1 DegQ family serine endoprotease [Herbaspirillum seropedicae]UMU21441.1 DegQ family serine endoprotease [Herbaspirillum seropedicae]